MLGRLRGDDVLAEMNCQNWSGIGQVIAGVTELLKNAQELGVAVGYLEEPPKPKKKGKRFR